MLSSIQCLVCDWIDNFNVWMDCFTGGASGKVDMPMVAETLLKWDGLWELYFPQCCTLISCKMMTVHSRPHNFSKYAYSLVMLCSMLGWNHFFRFPKLSCLGSLLLTLHIIMLIIHLVIDIAKACCNSSYCTACCLLMHAIYPSYCP